jgi:hypothetical protein
MNLFNNKSESYTLDLKDVMSKKEEQQPATYYMGAGKDGGVNFLIKSYSSVQELNFTRNQAQFLVEQFQFYIGEDDGIGGDDENDTQHTN